MHGSRGTGLQPEDFNFRIERGEKTAGRDCESNTNDVKILVLDEPTAAITDKETEMLFDIIRELKKQGIGIIYISHRLSELLEIGDVCTVMRDGEYIDTVNIKDTTEDELTRLMVGRQVSFEKLENPHLKKDEVVLSVKNLNYKNLVRNVSFDLHKGEILGFAGLVGAGRTETAKTIIGDYKKDSGTVIYKGKEIGTNLSENIKNGIVYLSEDRKDEGLILMHSVAENIALPNLPKLCKPFLNRRKERSVSKDYIKSLKIKTFSELTDAKNLSGGNQQKVVIAKWLYSDADIYIFDEPTRGIDVGARDEIYNIMYDLIAKGASIIMISSDLVEVLKMSDRVVVMREGRINGIVENDGMLTQEETMKMELAEEENMKDKRVNISDWIIYIGMICIFVVFTIICSALGKQFLTLNNVMNIINQASINAVVAIGASLVILTGGIDLSVGSVVGFVGIFLALRLQEGMPIPVAIILCLVLGAAVGLFNGILISYGKVPAFIVTLGSMQAVRGLAQIINGGQAVSGFPLEIGAVMKTKLFGVIPIGVLYVIVFYAVMILILSYTKFGRRIYAAWRRTCGRLSGIKVKKLEVAVYVLCGIFAAFAGVMLLSRLLYADPSAGNSYEMNAIAASVIGGISMSGGKGRLANTVAGAIILATLTNGLQIMNVATYYQTVITGLVVIVAVFVDKRKERKAE